MPATWDSEGRGRTKGEETLPHASQDPWEAGPHGRFSPCCKSAQKWMQLGLNSQPTRQHEGQWGTRHTAHLCRPAWAPV